MNKNILFVFLINLCFAITHGYAKDVPKKLYWVIFDGLRAEDELFDVYEWARKGELPNMRSMLEDGSYGYNIPVFPTQSFSCFASLLTGSYPQVHGVSAISTFEGDGLFKNTGFSSSVRNVPAIWDILEENGKNVCLLSIPGSTPPTLKKGVTIRGRWGMWGADFMSMVFDSKVRDKNYNAELYEYIRRSPEKIVLRPAKDWLGLPQSFSPALEAKIERYGSEIFIYIYDTTDDNVKNYDHIIFSFDKKKAICRLKEGQWSAWIPAILTWQKSSVDTFMRIKLIRLDSDGNPRIYIIYNPLNETTAEPPSIAKMLLKFAGPMVDYPESIDLLLTEPNDKQTFLEEMNMAFEWHKKAIRFILKEINPDVFILDGLSPNQMLTALFWMRYIDPKSKFFNDIDEQKRQQLWREVIDMYKKADEIVGELLKYRDKNTVVVVNSDHGMTARNKMVNLNAVFFKKGYIKIRKTKFRSVSINFQKTKVILTSPKDIYINPEGFNGERLRSQGRDYENLRNKVKTILLNLKDEDGVNPFEAILEREKAKDILHLPMERSGDLVLVMKEGYYCNFRFNENNPVFSIPRQEGGHKHALEAHDKKSLWTPFLISGPGIRKNYRISKAQEQIDICPTIYKLMNINFPFYVQGKSIDEIIE